MAYARRTTYRRRTSARRAYGTRRSYSAVGRRRTTRRTNRARSGSRVQTVRIVVDTGAASRASLGPSGMVKPAPRPRQAKF